MKRRGRFAGPIALAVGVLMLGSAQADAAHDLTVSLGVPTAGVTSTTVGGVTTYAATADDATLDAADLQAAWAHGPDVRITTGTTGQQAGNMVVGSLGPQGGTLELEAAGDVTVTAALPFASGLSVRVGTGAIKLEGGLVQTAGTQRYMGPVVLGATTDLTSASGAIRFADSVDGAHGLSVASATGTTFGGPVGSTVGLSSLYVGGAAAEVAGGIASVGPQNYAGPLTLSADVALIGGEITFQSGITGGGHDLDVISASPQSVFGSVSGVNALTFAGGGETRLMGGSVSTSGDQRYENPLRLSAATTFRSTSGEFIANGPVQVAAGQQVIEAPGVIAGVVSGSAGLIKAGRGTLRLLATNTFTGGLSVTGGRLDVAGDSRTAPVQLRGGALMGHGFTGPITGAGGTISPGSSPGILAARGLELSDADRLEIELDGTTPGTGHDQLDVDGPIALGDAALRLTLGFSPAVGDAFTVIRNRRGDPVSGTFAGLPEGGWLEVDGHDLRISYAGGAGHDVVLTRAQRSPVDDGGDPPPPPPVELPPVPEVLPAPPVAPLPLAAPPSKAPKRAVAPCRSRRTVGIHVRRGQTVLSGRIIRAGRAVRRVKTSRRTASVDLRGLRSGTYRVRLQVRDRHGKRTTVTRTYRTCQRPDGTRRP